MRRYGGINLLPYTSLNLPLPEFILCRTCDDPRGLPL